MRLRDGGSWTQLGSRNTPTRWIVSHAYRIDLPANLAALTLVARHDARRTRWFTVDALPALAFDHAQILRVAVGV